MESSVKGTLAISTYLGGTSEDSIRDVATDSAGNIFITGGTASFNFPVSAGSFDTSFNGNHDVFVAKLNSSGSILWATFLGGPNYDRAYALEVDSLGFVYIAGRAGSGFPTTSGVVQPQFGGDVTQNQAYGQQDGFVAKLSPDGSRLIWSTFFGSDGRDFIRDIDVDSSGNVYLGVSDVTRPHPHIRPGAFQTTLRGTEDGVVAKLSSDARSVVWASYFGGSGDDGGAPSVRVDSSGNLFYLTNTNSSNAPTTANAYRRTYSGGWDVLLARISSDGTWLVYSTYLGGSALEFTETHGLDIDSSGNAYAAFSTKSANIPTTSTAFQRTYGGSGGSGTGNNTNYPGDAFVAKISPDGTQLLAGTYLGGRYGEGAEGVAVDSAGNVCISGATYSDNFPLSSGALQVGLRGAADQFVVKLSSNLSQLLYSSYLGGSRTDLGRAATLDTNGNLYVAGVTDSTNFPLNNPPQSFYGGGVDATLTRVSLAGCQPLLSQSSESFSATGGVGSVSVTAETSCSWTVTDNASWITITSSSSGSGSATISFSVAPNSGTSIRSATITVAGQNLTIYQGINFNDVPAGHVFYTEIGKLAACGVTVGCGGGGFCPDQVVTREQMAAFIIRALGEFNPPTPSTQRFVDVPPSNAFYAFIDQMAIRQITLGCGPGMYCPRDVVTRDQMAALIIRGLGELNPPVPATQRYSDVPPTNPFYRFIDRLAVLGITQGCGGSSYCPGMSVSRGQMAAFLVRAFDL